jgi:hypothetical protein
MHIARQTADLKLSPSEETIGLGPLAVRLLLTVNNSNPSIAAFELIVLGEQHLAPRPGT